MELQLALDFCKTYEGAREILEQTKEYVDIVELGTPLLMENGLSIITLAKRDYPNLKVLADLKIMDAGWYETEEAFKAGADIVTVMAVTENKTIEEAVRCAAEYKRKIMVDLLASREPEKRIQELDEMGVDYICMHTSKDLQRDGMNRADTFRAYKKYIKKAGIAIAGGITADTAADYADMDPDVLIVGEGIVSQTNRMERARAIKETMKRVNR